MLTQGHKCVNTTLVDSEDGRLSPFWAHAKCWRLRESRLTELHSLSTKPARETRPGRLSLRSVPHKPLPRVCSTAPPGPPPPRSCLCITPSPCTLLCQPRPWPNATGCQRHCQGGIQAALDLNKLALLWHHHPTPETMAQAQFQGSALAVAKAGDPQGAVLN